MSRETDGILFMMLIFLIYTVVFSAIWGTVVMMFAAVLNNYFPSVPAFSFWESVIVGVFISLLIAIRSNRR